MADLRYWRVAVVVRPIGRNGSDKVVPLLTDLLGVRPRQVGGVWLWDVRSRTGY